MDNHTKAHIHTHPHTHTHTHQTFPVDDWTVWFLVKSEPLESFRTTEQTQLRTFADLSAHPGDVTVTDEFHVLFYFFPDSFSFLSKSFNKMTWSNLCINTYYN